jgi:deoxyribodipyrimidine photo-lyase
MGPKILIYLLRRDLRLADNSIFHELSSPSSKYTHLLPLYVFSATQIETSGFRSPSSASPWPFPEARSRVGAFWRCGPHRARFLAESVWDLKKSLEDSGSGLIIRAGTLEGVVKEALEFYQQGKGEKEKGEIVGVWMTGEETSEEKIEENRIRKVVEKYGKEFRLFKDEKYYIDE